MEQELLRLVQGHLAKHNYPTAVFYADKLAAMQSERADERIQLFCECLFLNGEYSRVVNVLERHQLLNKSLQNQVLAGKAMLAAQDPLKCLRILQDQIDEQDTQLLALKKFLIGKAHEARESKSLASEFYCEALQLDPTLQEAFDSLIQSQLLTVQQEKDLIYNLICPQWLKDHYSSYLKAFSPPPQVFYNTVDYLLAQGEQFLRQHKVEQAYELSCQAHRQDPYCLKIVPLQCACMVALGEAGELYSQANTLVRDCKNTPAAWYSAGAYYYTIRKFELARKFFMKSYKISKQYLPAWLAYGHTYAAQDQSDQAMSAYRTVARLFPGCYQAHLYMGMEYLRTKNLRTALLSLELAKSVCVQDPVVWNEIGVVLYKKQEFQKANEIFQEALLLSDDSQGVKETILFNLGHTCRKLGDLMSAIRNYNLCIQLNSKNASTYSALGLAYYLNGEVQLAVDSYNKALFLKSNDRFTNDLLYIALFECSETLDI